MKKTDNKNAQKAQYKNDLEGNYKVKYISVAPMMDWTNSNNNPLK